MLLRLDELNALKADLMQYRGNLDKLKDLAYDWLLLAYADGNADVEDQLGGEHEVSVDRVDEVINAEVGGKTVMERVEEDDELDDIEDLIDILNNERKRVYNTAGYDTATALKAKYKTWNTMEDDKVRDPHVYLNGMTKKIDEEFHTYTGDSAQHPGGFGVAEQDINCRCYLTYSN